MPLEPSVSEAVRAQISVRGVVQGVNFRWFAQRRANELNLTGFARNMGDGSVQVVAEGERAAIERLVEALRLGPPAAIVEKVTAELSAPTGEFHRFEARY